MTFEDLKRKKSIFLVVWSEEGRWKMLGGWEFYDFVQ